VVRIVSQIAADRERVGDFSMLKFSAACPTVIERSPFNGWVKLTHDGESLKLEVTQTYDGNGEIEII
jgi:hypothetical protein